MKSELTEKIKAITPLSGQWYAAYMSDESNDIESKIVPLVCWSLISYANGNPDEVVGQIVNGDAIVEVSYVDEEEGFGSFLGYFDSIDSAKAAISDAESMAAEEEDEEEGDEEDEEEEDEEEDDEDEED